MYPLTIHMVMNVSYPGTVLCLSDERRLCYFRCSVTDCQFVIILVLAEGFSKCMDLVCPSVLHDLLSVANGNYCTPGIEQLTYRANLLFKTMPHPCYTLTLSVLRLHPPAHTSSYHIQLAPISVHVSDVTYCL